jgi:hypothetical protein
VKSLANALAAWQPSAVSPGEPLLVLQGRWPEIVGEDIAAHSRPGELARGVLVIVTQSSAWSHQLSFLSDRILQALRRHTDGIERLRFRVGRLRERTALPASNRTRRRRRSDHRDAPATLDAALDRFRADVAAMQRAKAAAGWKECPRCGARTLAAPAPFCVPCGNAQMQQREARVARLLFEAPWLGFSGVADLVDGIDRGQYESIRVALLRRWRDGLDRLARSPQVRVTARDRSIASSYVLLKSGLEPERISPAIVRDLLGDELHARIYGTTNS